MASQFIEMKSVWAAGGRGHVYPALDADRHVDVVVIGGGIAGVTAAYLLKQAGRTVALVDQRRCGSGETGRSAAHVTAVTDMTLSALVERLGPDRAQAVWHAGFTAMSRLRANVRDERIKCDFGWVRGWLHAASTGDADLARRALAREAAIAGSLGVDATFVPDVPGCGVPGICFENQARLDPVRYLDVLVDQIHGDGSVVFENTQVDAIEEQPWAVRAGAYRISAEYVIVATHLPMPLGAPSDRVFESDLRLSRTYVLGGLATHGEIGEGLYWEHRDDAYEYLRVDRRETHDEILFGGEDHASGPEDQSLEARDWLLRLERRLRERIPGVRVVHRWSGQVVNTPDGLPMIGELAPGRFVATGFGGNGITFGTLAGMMAVDAALGRPNPWRDLFDPRRRRVLAGAWPTEAAGRVEPWSARAERGQSSHAAIRRDGKGSLVSLSEFSLSRAQ